MQYKAGYDRQSVHSAALIIIIILLLIVQSLAGDRKKMLETSLERTLVMRSMPCDRTQILRSRHEHKHRYERPDAVYTGMHMSVRYTTVKFILGPKRTADKSLAVKM